MADGALKSGRLRGLAPIVASDARVLILGSFPSEASLAAGQYYAHPRNHFWPLLAAVLDEPLPALAYSVRLARLKARGIAVWDTIVSCDRNGSLDTAIRNAQRGEVRRIEARAPDLKLVAFNGGTAFHAEPAWRAAGYATLALPSSSPAYTRPVAEKLETWRAISAYLDL
ncbi:MAG: DNA-deoxyinosine glycosylase [Betaproteobacteria bacterium]